MGNALPVAPHALSHFPFPSLSPREFHSPVTEYSPAKGEYPSDIPQFSNRACCEKHLKDNKHNSLHLARKYARILVLSHYLFLEAHSFPRANDNVRGQISEHISAPNGGYCLFLRRKYHSYSSLCLHIMGVKFYQNP